MCSAWEDFVGGKRSLYVLQKGLTQIKSQKVKTPNTGTNGQNHPNSLGILSIFIITFEFGNKTLKSRAPGIPVSTVSLPTDSLPSQGDIFRILTRPRVGSSPTTTRTGSVPSGRNVVGIIPLPTVEGFTDDLGCRYVLLSACVGKGISRDPRTGRPTTYPYPSLQDLPLYQDLHGMDVGRRGGGCCELTF